MPIELKDWRRFPAICAHCRTLVKLTVTHAQLVKLGALSHDCAAKKLIEDPPERGTRGRLLIVLPR